MARTPLKFIRNRIANTGDARPIVSRMSHNAESYRSFIRASDAVGVDARALEDESAE
jgi:hypothetical protein